MREPVKVACVQAEPVILDRDATIEKLAETTAEAAREGARLVVFPETFVPAYPSSRWAKALAGWAAQVPEGFRFALKAPFWVVNQKKGARSVVGLDPFLEVTSLLGARRGPILFQLAPNLKREPARLQKLLDALPSGVQAAFELQDPSWFHDQTWEALARAGAALCITEDEEFRTPVQKTARWAYLRLRRGDYDQRAIGRWRSRIAALKLEDDAYVYFKHEDSGTGPRFARLLQAA